MTTSKPMLKQEAASSHCGVNHSARPGLVWYLIRYQHDKVLKICECTPIWTCLAESINMHTKYIKKNQRILKVKKRCALFVELNINKKPQVT